MSGVIMDFPQAWDFVANTDLADHHDKCSYRQTERGMLCDCAVIWDEYHRRAKIVETQQDSGE